MLSNILGAITVLTGILWLAKPNMLRNKLKKKINRKLRMAICGFIVFFGFLIIRSVMKLYGIIPRILGIIGFIIIIKGILLLMTQASQKLLDWMSNRPLVFFRIWAACIIAMGIMLILA